MNVNWVGVSDVKVKFTGPIRACVMSVVSFTVFTIVASGAMVIDRLVSALLTRALVSGLMRVVLKIVNG